MTRRDRIGLLALAVVVTAGATWYVVHRPQSVGAISGQFDSLDAFTLNDPPGPAQPPVLPPADFGDGFGATLFSVESYVPPVDGPFGRPPATTQPESGNHQLIVVRFGVRDPQATNSQDHAVRINGGPARASFARYLSGANGQMTFASALVDASLKRATLELGIATGPFVEVERMAIGNSSSTIAPDAPTAVPFRIQSLEAGEGQLIVHLTMPSPANRDAFADQSWLLQAFCRDGRVLSPMRYEPVDERTGVARIRVDPKDVSYVAYRTRPYLWRTIGEVDLPPMAEMPAWPGRRPRSAVTTQPTSRPAIAPSPELERRMRERRQAERSATHPEAR